MTGPPAETAAVRHAVRRALVDLPARAPVLAAVSGGPDSLALAVGLAHVRPGSGVVVIDHGLQDGSPQVARTAAARCGRLGLAPEVVTVRVRGAGEGPARTARLLALETVAARTGAVVLLGHTLDDQAETVLLGLARGAGARSLSGMAAVRGIFRRPLLGVSRQVTHAACAQAGLTPWLDPHNQDPSYARVRVRTSALPALEAALGPGVTAALARSASLLREDADGLDALAAAVPTGPTLEVALLAALLPAVRARVLKTWAEQRCGAPVTTTHLTALRALVEHWSGQGAVALPGGRRVERSGGRLAFAP